MLGVFLCHASQDKPAVRDLYRRLKDDGFAPWLDDENLIPGQDWRQEINAAVRRSDVVIVCLSRDSTTKEGYIQKEIKTALDVAEEKPLGTIFVIPGRLEDVEVPERLRAFQWVNLFQAGGYEKLLAALDRKSVELGIPRPDMKQHGSPYPPGRRKFLMATKDRFLPNAPDTPAVLTSVDGKRLKFTGLNKVFYPHDGYTKRDIINFYAAVADLILPHLRGRPLSLRRYPNGIEGESFFQKEAPAGIPEWLHTKKIATHEESSTRFVIADDKASLLYLANLGCIDQNPWMSRLGSLAHPDFILIDLDPYHCGYNRIIEAAQLVRRKLDRIGLSGYPKTTGGDGMHICVPLEPMYSFPQARSFAEILAHWLASERPDLFTTPRTVAAREKGKVYFDYLQISSGKTISAPYVLRAYHGAPVATPLAWDEVKPGLRPTQFNIVNALRRFDRVGDLFDSVLYKPQRIETALGRLTKELGGPARVREVEIQERTTTLAAGEAADREFEQLAIREARKSVSENDGRWHPRVGAVVVKDGRVLATAHRGEHIGNHAEYIALEKKLPDTTLAGATVYTTLEPCTTRNHPKTPCADRLIERKIKRVVIGMLDPDPRITGRGLRKLRSANIITDLFPHDLMSEVEEMNRDFTRGFDAPATYTVE